MQPLLSRDRLPTYSHAPPRRRRYAARSRHRVAARRQGRDPAWSVTQDGPATTSSALYTYGHPLVDGPMLDRLPALRVISNYGVGVDHIRVGMRPRAAFRRQYAGHSRRRDGRHGLLPALGRGPAAGRRGPLCPQPGVHALRSGLHAGPRSARPDAGHHRPGTHRPADRPAGPRLRHAGPLSQPPPRRSRRAGAGRALRGCSTNCSPSPTSSMLCCPLTDETRGLIDARGPGEDEADGDPGQHRPRPGRRYGGADRGSAADDGSTPRPST